MVKKAIMYGAGGNAKHSFWSTMRNGLNTACFVDKDPSK